MTQAISVRSIRPAESRFIAAVCAAHMISHYYMLLLAPLFMFVRADFNVSYTELALALTVFNVVSGLLQTPIGFLVDRIGARIVLIAGLAVASIAYAIAGIANSYWVFVAMYGLAGVGNTVFHPSDYSLLSHHTPKERLGQVFAFHSFAGIARLRHCAGDAAHYAGLFRLARRLCGRVDFRSHRSVGADRSAGAEERYSAARQCSRQGSHRRGRRLAHHLHAADLAQSRRISC